MPKHRTINLDVETTGHKNDKLDDYNTDTKSGRRWEDAKRGLLITAVILIVFIAAVVTVLLVWGVHKVNSTDCDDNIECTSNAEEADGTCLFRHKNSATVCSQCYTSKSGHCDPVTADCVGGTVADCYGTCDADSESGLCDNLWPWSLDYLADVINNVNFQTLCMANECIGLVYFPFLDGDNFWDSTASAMPTARCHEFLNHTFYAANQSCIEIERYVLPWGSSDESADYHACVFRYKCAKPDIDWLNDYYNVDASNVSKRRQALPKAEKVASLAAEHRQRRQERKQG